MGKQYVLFVVIICSLCFFKFKFLNERLLKIIINQSYTTTDYATHLFLMFLYCEHYVSKSKELGLIAFFNIHPYFKIGMIITLQHESSCT